MSSFGAYLSVGLSLVPIGTISGQLGLVSNFGPVINYILLFVDIQTFCNMTDSLGGLMEIMQMSGTSRPMGMLFHGIFQFSESFKKFSIFFCHLDFSKILSL